MPPIARYPRFDYEHVAGLRSDWGEIFILNDRAIYALERLSGTVLWPTQWENKPASQSDLEALQWEIVNQMSAPIHFDDLLPEIQRIAVAQESLMLDVNRTAVAQESILAEMARAADAQEGILAAIEALPQPGDPSASIDALTAVLSLLDPRLAVLLQLVDSIDDVLGGSFEP